MLSGKANDPDIPPDLVHGIRTQASLNVSIYVWNFYSCISVVLINLYNTEMHRPTLVLFYIKFMQRIKRMESISLYFSLFSLHYIPISLLYLTVSVSFTSQL